MRKPPNYWTEERIVEAAAGCFNKAELKSKFYGAYKVASKSGQLDILFPYQGKKLPVRKWTEVSIRNEAAGYSDKRSFEIGCASAYNAANKRHPGLLSDIFGEDRSPVVLKWTEVKVREEAANYADRNSFSRYAHGAYNAAKKLGIIDELFDPKLAPDWDEARVRVEAEKFETLTAFQRGNGSAYNAARRLGIHRDLGFPEDRAPSDNDAIYIWRAVGQYFNGNPVYKIGVTSARLGTHRIERCSRSNGFGFEIICCEAVQGKASDLEKKLLILGEDPQFSGFDGATEFRALSDSALYVAVSMICGAM